jgi:hypothetical protein
VLFGYEPSYTTMPCGPKHAIPSIDISYSAAAQSAVLFAFADVSQLLFGNATSEQS